MAAPAAFGAQAQPACSSPAGNYGKYSDLDNVEGSYVALASFPIRPMTFTPDGQLWAVNTQDSTVVHFTGLAADPHNPIRVPWNPVSIAWWTNAENVEDILVVCRSTWTLVRLDRVTADIKEIIPLEAEPSDILVDQVSDRAFVSCAGGDTVLQIDLNNTANIERYHIRSAGASDPADPAFRCKTPLFMSFYQPPGTEECTGPDTPSGCVSKKVLVAPLHSGNNTTSGGGQGGPVSRGSVIDLEQQYEVPPGSGIFMQPIPLPDEDLFLIDPDAGAHGTVTVAAKRLGTILFQNGINPLTHDFWQLNTDANNKDAAAQSEPQVSGAFATNRVTILPNPDFSSVVTPAATDYIGLDPSSVTGITTATTVAQPYSITFHPTLGYAFITGLGSDNVMVLQPNGAVLKEWDVGTTPGAIPRAIILSPTPSVAAVYCYGDNTIRTYRWANTPPTPLAVFQLGYDPAPQNVRDGRKVFFSAKNSKDHNLSCATCHVDGGMDFLVWNLSNKPHDDKGPMATQTLIGLERLGPFHWRGERDLIDFNKAFNGLLGMPVPPSGVLGIPQTDFDNMQAFLFSLKNPPNPFEDRTRLVSDQISFAPSPYDGTGPAGGTVPGDPPFGWQTGGTASAVQGQNDFRGTLTFAGSFTCQQCHAQPSGTNNDVFIDDTAEIPERVRLKVAPFHEEWRKEQPTVEISHPVYDQLGALIGFGHDRRALLGTGTSHAGLTPTVFNFANAILNSLTRDHITAFIHQWDQGLAPAVHYAFLLNNNSAPGTPNDELGCYLEKQAEARNCDIVVFGRVNGGIQARWFYDRYASGSKYRTDCAALTPSQQSRTLQQFITAAASESNVFIGLPVGMGERFAIDYDMDGIVNALDSAPTSVDPADPGDTTQPSFTMAPGPKPMWMTTRAARVRFDTDEPTSAVVTCTEFGTGAAPLTFTSTSLSKTHAVVLSGLRPSTSLTGYPLPWPYAEEKVKYVVDVQVTDRSGNSHSVSLSPSDFETDPFITPDPAHVILPGHDGFFREHRIDNLSLINEGTSGGNDLFRVDATVLFTRGPLGTVPASKRIVTGRVLIHDALSTQPLSTVTDFTPGGTAAKADFIAASGSPTRTLEVEPGPFIVNTTVSDALGHVVIQFGLPSSLLVNSGTTVTFSIEAVTAVTNIDSSCSGSEQCSYDLKLAALAGCTTPGTCTLFLPSGSKSFDWWDLPRTKEANSSTTYTVP